MSEPKNIYTFDQRPGIAFVLHADYAALQAERDRLQRERDAAQSAYEQFAAVVRKLRRADIWYPATMKSLCREVDDALAAVPWPT